MVTQAANPLHVQHQRGTGTPVVYLADHGFRALLWQDVAERLAPSGDWFAIDLVGSGRSPEPPGRHAEGPEVDPYDPRFQANALFHAVDGAGVPPFVLVGHGFSAQVAEQFASAYGDCLAGLVLVNPLHDGIHAWCDDRGRTLGRALPAAVREALSGAQGHLRSPGPGWRRMRRCGRAVSRRGRGWMCRRW